MEGFQTDDKKCLSLISSWPGWEMRKSA